MTHIAKVIGFCVDKVNDKIYWFITSNNHVIIAEYDVKTDTTAPVIVDYKRDKISEAFGSSDYITV